MSGVKHDSGKLPMDLLPGGPLGEVARVFGVGASIYGRDNWRKGFSWSRLYAAIQRHLWTFWGGENLNPGPGPETGLEHLAQAAWGCLVLLEFRRTHPELDDRWRPTEHQPTCPRCGVHWMHDDKLCSDEPCDPRMFDCASCGKSASCISADGEWFCSKCFAARKSSAPNIDVTAPRTEIDRLTQEGAFGPWAGATAQAWFREISAALEVEERACDRQGLYEALRIVAALGFTIQGPANGSKP